MIKRRVLVGLGACGWMPFASRGQAPTGNYILGYLGQGSKARMREPTHDLAVVLAHLKEQGFVEGRNLSVEARFAEGRFEDLSRLAHQLVQTKPQVIVVQNGGQAEAVVRQTKTVPVVALTAGLLEGLPSVKSLAKPGGNLTGMQMHSQGLIGKRLQLLYEAVPRLRRVVVLRAGRSAGGYALYHEATDAAAAKLNIRVRYVRFSNLAELEQRFEEMPRQQDQAVLVWNDPYLSLQIGRASCRERV